METRSTGFEELSEHYRWLIGMGIVLLIVGIMAVGSPMVTGVAVEYVIGSLLIIAGIGRIVHSFKAKSWHAGLLNSFTGIAAVICGAIMLAQPIFGLSFLALLLVIFFLAEGGSKVFFSLRLKPVKGWGITLFEGIIAILFGLLVWMQWPISGMWLIGLLVGLDIIFGGYSMLITGVEVRRAKHSYR